MTTFFIHPSKLQGEIKVPPSKSHTLRALIFALMAKGKSYIHNYLKSPDTDAMISAITELGAIVIRSEATLEIEGVAGRLHAPTREIDAGNSGQVLRFIAAMAALSPFPVVLTGDDSVRNRRPIKPLLGALEQMGALTEENPVRVVGPLVGNKAILSGEDSQPVSALLMASAFLSYETSIQVENPGERPWIDLTLFWLKKMGVDVSHSDYTYYKVGGKAAYDGFEVNIPGDWSSAAYPMVAGLVTHSEVGIVNVDREDVQGDKKLVDLLLQMGAHVSWDHARFCVQRGKFLEGIKADINDIIDMVTILPVIACFASQETTITGAAIARLKESDRIAAIVKELRKMGAKIEERPDGMVVSPSRLKGAELECHKDHRIGLALIVAALGAEGPSSIRGVECLAKSYPNFHDDFIKLGAIIEIKN